MDALTPSPVVDSIIIFPYFIIKHFLCRLSAGVVDAAVMGGTANYEEAFCNPLFLEMHPEKAKLVDKLQVFKKTKKQKQKQQKNKKQKRNKESSIMIKDSMKI